MILMAIVLMAIVLMICKRIQCTTLLIIKTLLIKQIIQPNQQPTVQVLPVLMSADQQERRQTQ